MLRVLSLGAGVQSSTMALMASRGEFDSRPDAAVFADTGWEPGAVYKHLEFLETVLPFPVIRARRSQSIRDGILARRNATGGRYASIPWHGVMPSGKLVMGRRQCTSEYKLTPIMRECRKLLGVSRRAYIAPASVEVWIGISTDEASRMMPARQQWMRNRWPLIERGMSRQSCLAWLSDNGFPEPPKSSCIGCPFHSDAHWRRMRDTAPAEWADAVLVDRKLREGDARGMNAIEYMHPSRVPLDEVDLSTAEDHGQINMFENECEGMCGV